VTRSGVEQPCLAAAVGTTSATRSAGSAVVRSLSVLSGSAPRRRAADARRAPKDELALVLVIGECDRAELIDRAALFKRSPTTATV
jgi:hypothetical protein